jgi:hypothetical protein
MTEQYPYYCQYCSQFVSTQFVCPLCNEYKGLIKVSENPELIEL